MKDILTINDKLCFLSKLRHPYSEQYGNYTQHIPAHYKMVMFDGKTFSAIIERERYDFAGFKEIMDSDCPLPLNELKDSTVVNGKTIKEWYSELINPIVK